MAHFRCLRGLTLLCFFVIDSVTLAQQFPKSVEEAYSRYKQDVLTKFTDKHGLIVDLNDGKPDGIGDSAWRTGIATICFAIEKDQVNTRKYLNALIEKCWRDGKPIRHPDSQESGKSTYSRDQFIPQMVACLFAYEFGDEQTKGLAKELYKKFIDKIGIDDWRLNEGEAATLKLPNQFAFFEVADRLGLARVQKLKDVSGREPRIAFLGALKAKSIELANSKTVKMLNGGDEVIQFYGVHLMFLESLVTVKCRPQTEGLLEAVKDVGIQAGKQNMGPFLWLAGDVDKARKYLETWPHDWNSADYVWQRSKLQQDKAAKEGLGKHEYSRLDYMLLRRLFDIEIRRK